MGNGLWKRNLKTAGDSRRVGGAANPEDAGGGTFRRRVTAGPHPVVAATERGKGCRTKQGTFRPHAVNDIHVRGFFVRGSQVHGAAAPFIGQARETHEVQQFSVTGLVALDECADEKRR